LCILAHIFVFHVSLYRRAMVIDALAFRRCIGVAWAALFDPLDEA